MYKPARAWRERTAKARTAKLGYKHFLPLPAGFLHDWLVMNIYPHCSVLGELVLIARADPGFLATGGTHCEGRHVHMGEGGRL